MNNKLSHTYIVNGDFLNTPIPKAVDYDDTDNTSSKRFINRELSWLAFNWRVLGEASNAKIPLLERVRMLSISNTNLDEFYTVRVAGLRALQRNDINRKSIDGKSPTQQLNSIDIDAQKLLFHQQKIWINLVDELAKEKITILGINDLNSNDMIGLREEFISQIFPILSPMAVDPAHPFPFISNGGLVLALNLIRNNDGRKLKALVPIPRQIDRFILLQNSPEGEHRFVLLETTILIFLTDLFPNYTLSEHCSFRILRDSDLEIEDEAEDLVREFETALKRRRRGHTVRLEITKNASHNLCKMIFNALNIKKSDAIEIDGLLGIGDISSLTLLDRSDLKWPKFYPRTPERIQEFHGDIFSAIQQKDILLHHPYETFDIVVKFLQQAAKDPDVIAIKQTLYRTSNQSPIVEALCEAAENGKLVTALVELKARFDEAANIGQSRRLERAGAHVLYGFINLKTHAKISIVIRRENGKLITYTHFGTGNYHPITANIYTDLSLFTCSKSLGRDAAKVFNYVSGYALPKQLKKLSVSPLTLKTDLISNIEYEATLAKNGQPAQIWAKMNALIDPDIIDALYKASQSGVKIDLIIRGICGLRPGIENQSENIRVKSIVGRFLEHSRISCFGNGFGLPHEKAKVYISSADWMERNFMGRVETLVSITNKTVHAQIMSQIMAANLADQQNSWILQANGKYLRHNTPNITDTFNCHRFFMENPSISGRGKAGLKGVVTLTHSSDLSDE